MTTLLLLHGLGGTGSAMEPLREVVDWRGPVLAPDLPGHGLASPLPSYGVRDVAAALARGLSGPVAVLGHSFGGAVGLALATVPGVRVTAAAALGVKVQWSDEDVERFASLAARPARTFGTREEALERHLAVAGLGGQPAEAHASGITGVADGWRLRMDPAVLAQVAPELASLVADAAGTGARVALLRGEHDPMVTAEDLQGCAVQGTAVLDLEGLGHSAHVEDPAAVWAAARGVLGR